MNVVNLDYLNEGDVDQVTNMNVADICPIGK